MEVAETIDTVDIQYFPLRRDAPPHLSEYSFHQIDIYPTIDGVTRDILSVAAHSSAFDFLNDED
jgi:hypothetical protein